MLFDELMMTVGQRFCRSEPRHRVRDFARGLLAPPSIKNRWSIAEHAGDACPDGMQDLLENCQFAVHLVYATDTAHATLDTALYLPKSWCDGPQRRVEAGIPEQVRFATKPQLAARMIEAAVTGGLP
ncbi:transposase [Micromonospora matsumotoense]|uniref:transposase n=1 Tax=Micromonospora matsumotoense TaxID=121616 RepID=UPI003D94E2B4